ncbi:MAG: UDP-N-acetylmuramoyl-L-alanyl-D-glutamate--2,6-diaminopimelate ligase [Oscillospiraceae bacterium]|nr:UDP-N-acetylmuramoyl-L-alanyl-D-glutamate--2,6-diaminopimelate ligase [Oscillospiraceae bacterium]
MTAFHPLHAYADALRAAGLLTEARLDDAVAQRVIDCFCYDNRAVTGTALFFCKGAHFREEYLRDALSRGAVAYVADRAFAVDAPCLLVSDIRRALVVLGRLYYNNVTDKLVTIGITGTKGKSTTAYYMRYILNDWLASQGKPDCALISSIDTYDGVTCEESHITTPEVLELYGHFQNALDSGITHLVMEASSQAFKVGRVGGMTFDVGAFLNIGEDHISPIEHPDFEDYFAAKRMLFDQCRVGCVNTDAEHMQRAVDYARGRCELITFGSHESDTVFCSGVEKRADGLYFTVRSPKYNGTFSITMPGLFNVSNALAAIAMSSALDIPEESVRRGLRIARASGRMQVYESRDGKVTVIVDYAHNRMSFDALFRSTRAEYPGKSMISIFGCPGSHALQRRKDLGELSGQNCDFVYITEEDSGEEPFAQIAADIERHVSAPHLVLEDRNECIRRAICEGDRPRVILLTGKGEEEYMKRGNAFVPYPSDVQMTLAHLTTYDETHP